MNLLNFPLTLCKLSVSLFHVLTACFADKTSPFCFEIVSLEMLIPYLSASRNSWHSWTMSHSFPTVPFVVRKVLAYSTVPHTSAVFILHSCRQLRRMWSLLSSFYSISFSHGQPSTPQVTFVWECCFLKPLIPDVGRNTGWSCESEQAGNRGEHTDF